jgi:hypothetical protein
VFNSEEGWGSDNSTELQNEDLVKYKLLLDGKIEQIKTNSWFLNSIDLFPLEILDQLYLI